jgi:hypothetical protein
MTLAMPRSNAAQAGAAGLVIALLAVVSFAVAAFVPAVLYDGDTWSHVATGEWIMAHGAVPRTDPFSYSMPGAPWTAHEWLSEILLDLAFRAGGWSGVALVTAFAVSSAALILGVRLARDLAGTTLFAVLLLGVHLWAPTLLARPHILALPLMALWTAGLLAARDRKASPPLALALVMIPWANMHGGFIFGVALIAPFAAEAFVEARPDARFDVARGWMLFAGAAVAAALVNPYGVEALVFPFRLLGVKHLGQIGEWRAQDFSVLGPMENALIILLGFALLRPMKAPPIRVALVVLLIAMALAHVRHTLLLGLVAPMLLARPIAEAIGARLPEDVRPTARTAVTVFLACALVLAALRAAIPIVRTDGPNAPVSAVAAVPAELRSEPVLNDYSFGGYLIFAHVRPFIDARAELYRDPMLALYDKLANGDPATIEATLARYGVAWTIFAPDDRIVAFLDHETGWRRLYADATAVVHVRDVALPGGER